MNLNYYAWLALERAKKAPNNLGTITFGTRDILMSLQAGNDVFLQSLFGINTPESAPLDVVLEKDAPEEISEDQTKIFSQKLASLMKYLRQLLGPDVTESEIKKLAEILARSLKGSNLRLTFVNHIVYSNIENLALWARSQSNGSVAWTDF